MVRGRTGAEVGDPAGIEQMFYHATPWRRLRRAPLPLQLLVPRRRLARSTIWSSGPSSWASSALAVTDHQGLYGAVRFATAAQEAGLRPIVGMEVELLDPAAPDPGGWSCRVAGGSGATERRARQSAKPALLPAGGPGGQAGRSIGCVRPVIGSRGARTCAASGRASWGRTSCCWRAT